MYLCLACLVKFLQFCAFLLFATCIVNKDKYNDFPIMLNKDTRCDESVVTCSDSLVITAYNVYVCISLVKLI